MHHEDGILAGLGSVASLLLHESFLLASGPFGGMKIKGRDAIPIT